MSFAQAVEIRNAFYSLVLRSQDGQVVAVLTDLISGSAFADSAYFYALRCPVEDGFRETLSLSAVTFTKDRDTVTLWAKVAGFMLEHRFTLPETAPILEESIALHNQSDSSRALADFRCGFQYALTNDVGQVLPLAEQDRFAAIPFRHKPSDKPGHYHDYDVRHLLQIAGSHPVVNGFAALSYGHGELPSRSHYSEGWAWSRGERTLGIFKFNQSAIEFSVLTINSDAGGAKLQFGGASLFPDDSALPITIAPGESLYFGVTRFQIVAGGYEQASYAFRDFLTQNGCSFPPDFNPPVHWNEIYDNAEYILGSPGRPPEPRLTRALTYTRALIRQEAVKAQAYHCEALYLDPGWDTDFATFLWGESWLGDGREFVQEIQVDFGLRVALHCPLSPWMSFDGRGVPSWPVEAARKAQDGSIIELESAKAGRVPAICLGSRQYLDEAERRLHQLCADGVAFLMFDGNWWQSECWDASHGHPVPYTKEAHCLANLELAQRVHARYPDVLIEMHDMITGGSIVRFTPVYYKYGLPGSYDDNWGFELMWQPMEDLRSGKALALYDYNLACNVPVYLHVDLRADNLHTLVFWWFASTCRHLGIGGTHANPVIAEAHKHAMKVYRQLERFFKRGSFFGASEEVHFHVLSDENAFVVCLFNLSDESRIVSGTIRAEPIGLDLDRWYVVPYSHAEGGFDSKTGTFRISRRLEPWSAQIAYIHPLES
jgi:hypothetical protein